MRETIRPGVFPGATSYRVFTPFTGLKSGWAAQSSLPEFFDADSNRESDVLLALEDYINDTTIHAPEFFQEINEVLVVGNGLAYLFELERPRVTVRLKP